MELKEAIRILELHNKWRRGDNRVKMANPKILGQVIEIIVNEVKSQHPEWE